MSVDQVKEEKSKSLFLYLFILCLACLHWSNPSVDSFKSYIRKQVAHYSGPFGCILSNLNVWYAHKTNSLQVHNLIFFSLINAPPYLMEILDSTNGRRCVFVGLLGNWAIGFLFVLQQCRERVEFWEMVLAGEFLAALAGIRRIFCRNSR